MSQRFPGRQWRSNLVALGGAHMNGPVELRADVIPYLGPPALWTYPSSSLALTVGVPMSMAPTITRGSPYAWSAAPTLPAGIVLDTVTGVISGTPSVPSASQLYIVSARSRGGGGDFRLTIVVT